MNASAHIPLRAVPDRFFTLAVRSKATKCRNSEAHVASLLTANGIIPTRLRVAIGTLLFVGEGRHLTVEMLFEEGKRAGIKMSLASAYNTANRFARAGLLKQVCVDGSKSYFDTNTTPHQHFYLEETHELVDIPSPCELLRSLPAPLDGYELTRVEVIVRIRKTRR